MIFIYLLKRAVAAAPPADNANNVMILFFVFIDKMCIRDRSIEDQMPEDFYSIDLMNAYEQLGTIIGESLEDDLVNEIFNKFCMGK